MLQDSLTVHHQELILYSQQSVVVILVVLTVCWRGEDGQTT
jgi:hypothetical protein